MKGFIEIPTQFYSQGDMMHDIEGKWVSTPPAYINTSFIYEFGDNYICTTNRQYSTPLSKSEILDLILNSIS